MYQLFQNLTAPSGRCEYKGVSHWVGFGTREAQVLFPSETGSTAEQQRGPATHPPSAPGPSAPHCPGGRRMDYPFHRSVGGWCPDPQGTPLPPKHPAGYPSQKSTPNHTPFFSSYPGKLGRGACHPVPSPPPPLARRNPAALPRVRRAGSIWDILMMNASSWNCGSVSQAWCSRAKM